MCLITPTIKMNSGVFQKAKRMPKPASLYILIVLPHERPTANSRQFIITCEYQGCATCISVNPRTIGTFRWLRLRFSAFSPNCNFIKPKPNCKAGSVLYAFF
jgi:hypothetical protein